MEQRFSLLQHANDTLCSYDNTHNAVFSKSEPEKKKSAARQPQGEKSWIIKPESPK